MYQVSNKFLSHERNLSKVTLSEYISWTTVEITSFPECVFGNALFRPSQFIPNAAVSKHETARNLHREEH